MLVHFLDNMEKEVVEAPENETITTTTPVMPSPEPEQTASVNMEMSPSELQNQFDAAFARFSGNRQPAQRSTNVNSEQQATVDTELFTIMDHFKACRSFTGFTLNENRHRNRENTLKVICSCRNHWDIAKSDYSKSFLESLQRHFLEQFGEILKDDRATNNSTRTRPRTTAISNLEV